MPVPLCTDCGLCLCPRCLVFACGYSTAPHPCCKVQQVRANEVIQRGGADGGAVCCAQTDKKTLNTKVMMQEMKEIREKRRSAETTAKVVSVQTPFVFPLNPDITLNCQDECGCLSPPRPPLIYRSQ